MEFITGGKRRWAILVFAVIILAALSLLLALKKPAASPSLVKNLSTFTVRKDNLTVTVTENGSIKARNAINIKSDVEGQVTIISIVPEGTYITPEDVNNKILVEMDSSNLTENRAQREIEFAGAESSYAEANEAYAIQVKQNESDITAADLKVRFALMDFKKYLGETLAEQSIEAISNDSNSTYNMASLLNDPNKLGTGEAGQKLKDLEDQIKLAESKLAKAIYKLEGTQQLYDANYVAEIELQGDRLDKQSLDIQKAQADISLQLFKLYDFPKQAEKLLSDYYEAGRELDRTYARSRSKLAQAMAQLKSAEATFQLRKDRLEKLKRQIAACTIKAPAPGLVVYASSSGDFFHREGPIEAGSTVRQRQEIMSLPDTSEMIVEINVHESSVTKVHPDQTAKIVIDAFPDRVFTGKVLKIAPLPDQQRGWLNPDLKVYTTQVNIDGSYDFLKPGMSAKVEVLIEQLDDVVIVPVQVVANRGGKKVCYCMTPDGPQQKEVQTGSFNDTFVQITDGLETGEEVLMNLPRIIEPTVAVASQQPTKPTDNKTPQDKGDVQQNKPLQEIRSDTQRQGPPRDGSVVADTEKPRPVPTQDGTRERKGDWQKKGGDAKTAQNP